MNLSFEKFAKINKLKHCASAWWWLWEASQFQLNSRRHILVKQNRECFTSWSDVGFGMLHWSVSGIYLNVRWMLSTTTTLFRRRWLQTHEQTIDFWILTMGYLWCWRIGWLLFLVVYASFNDTSIYADVMLSLIYVFKSRIWFSMIIEYFRIIQIVVRTSDGFCILVDPASCHMLVSKIKPCMSKFS